MEDIASIVAPLATTFAALIVASNLGARITGFGFIVFTLGSVAWSALGFTTDQPNLLWQNVVLTGLNLFGVWRWLGWQARIEEGAQSAARDSHEQEGEDLFPVSLLMKAKVVSQDGRDMGRCVDAMAGCGSGRIGYLVVAEGGVAGVGETLRRLPWSGCSVDGDRVSADPARAILQARSTRAEPLAGALIIHAEIAKADFALLDSLRRRHYPSERNRVPAHLTLFRALPPSSEDEVRRSLVRAARAPAPEALIGGVMDLDSGVALRVVSSKLEQVRYELASEFHGLQSAQDVGRWTPHVTIQNKVEPRVARLLLLQMRDIFEPWPLKVTGLGLVRYVEGEWEPVASYRFRGA